MAHSFFDSLLPTKTSLAVYGTFYLYICIASLLLPSKKVKGHPSPKRGPRLEYTINGFRLTCLTVFLVFIFGGVVPSLSFLTVWNIANLVHQFWPLFSTVFLFTILISILLYLKGVTGKSVLGEHVDTHTHGSFGLDFWVGRELNPRIGNFDIKFVAYRVGMLWWLMLNFGFLACQIQSEEGLTLRMVCYQFATSFYIFDYFWNEQKMLTTWDIISEEFGMMLVFGDYFFIPFAFSVQGHFLLGYEDFSSAIWVLVVIGVYFIGFYIFRTSNSQKNQFKTEPSKPIWGKSPQAVGGKLLVSGFWGYGRHMNYTGDLIMSIAYCLPCGNQIGGYFYTFYLFTLLLQRACRDDAKCSVKYGGLWKNYCERVPYVYVPFGPIDNVLTGIGKSLYWVTNGSNKKKSE